MIHHSFFFFQTSLNHHCPQCHFFQFHFTLLDSLIAITHDVATLTHLQTPHHHWCSLQLISKLLFSFVVTLLLFIIVLLVVVDIVFHLTLWLSLVTNIVAQLVFLFPMFYFVFYLVLCHHRHILLHHSLAIVTTFCHCAFLYYSHHHKGWDWICNSGVELWLQL